MDFKKILQKFNQSVKRQSLDTVYGSKSGKYLLIVWVFCFLLSSVFLLICTKSSPLYPFNDSTDVNAFFTVGKGMMDGLVPYRDLFEQKGPLLYFIYGISYLISARSFLGAYFIEVVAFSFFLFFSYRSLALLINHKISMICLPLLTALILNMKTFTHGGNAEELSLPLLSGSLYFLISFFKDDDPRFSSNKIMLLNGVFAGSILWIKFSLLGFWIGWILSFFLILLSRKQFRRAFLAVVIFLVGIFLATIPWLIYFGVNHSISEWINTYFFINFSSYNERFPLYYRFYLTLSGISTQIRSNPVSGSILWLGIIAFLVFPKFLKDRLHRIGLFFCVFLLIFGVFGGGRGYIYTCLITTPFLIFGFYIIFDLIKNTYKKELTVKKPYLFTLLLAIISFIATILFNHNIYFMKITKDELVQFKFASIIKQTKNPTLLNFGSLDLGFYFASDIIPKLRFFENQNIDYARFPLILDEQNRYIKEKLIDFVVIVLPDETSVMNLDKLSPVLMNNYQVINEDYQTYEDNEYIYLLLKKIP